MKQYLSHLFEIVLNFSKCAGKLCLTTCFQWPGKTPTAATRLIWPSPNLLSQVFDASLYALTNTIKAKVQYLSSAASADYFKVGRVDEITNVELWRLAKSCNNGNCYFTKSASRSGSPLRSDVKCKWCGKCPTSQKPRLSENISVKFAPCQLTGIAIPSASAVQPPLRYDVFMNEIIRVCN